MDSNSAIVSVIMPCYNQGQYLDEAIESVLAQTYQNFEIIVINDGSTDEETIQILHRYERPGVEIIHTQNCGPSAARNTGIKHSRGKYILPLDADDRIGQNYLEAAVKILDTDSTIGIVYCEAEFFGTKIGKWELPEFQFPEILLGNTIFNSSLYRRADWEIVGGYRENMVYNWEDYDLWLSLIELGRGVVRIPEILYFYRQVPNSRDHQTTREQRIQCHTQIYQNHTRLFSDNIDYIFRRIADKNDAIESSAAQARGFETTLQETQGQLQQTQEQLQETQGQLQQTQGQLQQTQEQLRQTQEQLQQAQGQLQQTQGQLQQSQAQLQQSQAHLEQSQGQLQQSQAQLQRSQGRLQQTQGQLGQANSRIEAMQTSKFWKLRSAWFRVKSTIGLPTEDS